VVWKGAPPRPNEVQVLRDRQHRYSSIASAKAAASERGRVGARAPPRAHPASIPQRPCEHERPAMTGRSITVMLEEVMAILRIIRSHQGREAYDAVAAIVDIGHQHPLGLIMHGATEVDGKMQIAEVWDSKEYARHFDEEHLLPAAEAAGVLMAAEVTIFELEHLVTP
jgi:hypothetical protein